MEQVKKKNRISTWIFLAFSLFTNFFILLQASLPGDSSSGFSNFIYSVIRIITNGNDLSPATWQYDPSTEPVNPPSTSYNFEFIEVESGVDIKDKTYKAEVNQTLNIWIKQVNVPDGGVTFTETSTDESVASVSWVGNHINIDCLSVGNTRITLTANDISHYLDLTIIAEGIINHKNTPSIKKAIRKGIGHFLLFTVDAIFTSLFLIYFFKDKNKLKLWQIICISIAIGLFMGALTEIIQYFVPGRVFASTDILIDFSGYLLGALIIWLIMFQMDIKKNKTKEITN